MIHAWHAGCQALGVRSRHLSVAVTLALVAGCGSDDVPQTFAPPPGSATGEVEIDVPAKLSSIEAGKTDALGQPVRIACATCHTVKETARLPDSPSKLKDFHVGLTVEHGSTTCASCHVSEPRRAPELHLADGTRLPMTEAMQLCAQCHGPQWRDYKAGAHGGMNGAWDLSRGGRTRNHCVDCHDPHVPKVPAVQPAARMNDRRPLEGEPHHEAEHP